MIGIRKKCPHCKHKQFIPVQIIVENETITIAEPYIVCDMCMEQFKIELRFITKEINLNGKVGN